MKALSRSWPFGLLLLQTRTLLFSSARVGLAGLDARCLAWPFLVGFAWLGLAWLGLAWLGLAWLGLAWLGLAWLGLAWLGLAWLGLAWLGMSPLLSLIAGFASFRLTL